MTDLEKRAEAFREEWSAYYAQTAPQFNNSFLAELDFMEKNPPPYMLANYDRKQCWQATLAAVKALLVEGK